MRGEMDTALKVAKDLLRRAEREDRLDAQLAAHRLAGVGEVQAGHLHLADQHLKAATSIIDAIGEAATGLAGGKEALVTVPAYRAVVLILLGHYDQARVQSALSLDQAEKVARPHLLAFALATSIGFHEMLREDSSHLLMALSTLATERDFPYWTGYTLIYRGFGLVRAGELQEGIALVREGTACHDAGLASWSMPLSLGMAAELAEGNEALSLVALVDDEITRVERTGLRWLEPELRRIRGMLLAVSGDTAGAEAQFTEAISIARIQGARHWELRAATSLARLWYDQGRSSKALNLLASVYGWFNEGLGTPDLMRAKALLDQFSRKARRVLLRGKA
jgi:predicted ATPase